MPEPRAGIDACHALKTTMSTRQVDQWWMETYARTEGRYRCVPRRQDDDVDTVSLEDGIGPCVAKICGIEEA